MSNVIYRYLLWDHQNLISAIERIESLARDQILDGLICSRVSDNKEKVILLLTRDNFSCTVQTSRLSNQAPSIRAYSECLEFMAAANTQEDMGLCWEILIGLTLEVPGDIWLSTYSGAALPEYIPKREVKFSDGDRGLLLFNSEFRRFVELS